MWEVGVLLRTEFAKAPSVHPVPLEDGDSVKDSRNGWWKQANLAFPREAKMNSAPKGSLGSPGSAVGDGTEPSVRSSWVGSLCVPCPWVLTLQQAQAPVDPSKQTGLSWH